MSEDLRVLAQAMADAIQCDRYERSRTRVGRDGRAKVTSEAIAAAIALDDAERAFREATQQRYIHLPAVVIFAERGA